MNIELEIVRRLKLWWWNRKLAQMSALIVTAAEQRREHSSHAQALLQYMKDVDSQRSTVQARILLLESPQVLIREATQ